MTETHRGSIVLSCGCRHEDAMGDLGDLHVRYRSESCDAVDGYCNAVAYAVYCPACRGMLAREGLLIVTEEEERAWLDGVAKRGDAVLGKATF